MNVSVEVWTVITGYVNYNIANNADNQDNISCGIVNEWLEISRDSHLSSTTYKPGCHICINGL